MTYIEIADRIYVSNTIYRYLKALVKGEFKNVNVQVTYRSISKDKDIKVVNVKNFVTAYNQCKSKVANDTYKDYIFILDIFTII